jgi:DNA-binding response OmpR family regulator
MVIENTCKTLLLIADDPADAKLVLDALVDPRAAPFDVKWAMQLRDGLRLLSAEKIALALLDLDLTARYEHARR